MKLKSSKGLPPNGGGGIEGHCPRHRTPNPLILRAQINDRHISPPLLMVSWCLPRASTEWHFLQRSCVSSRQAGEEKGIICVASLNKSCFIVVVSAISTSTYEEPLEFGMISSYFKPFWLSSGTAINLVFI